MNKIVTLCMVVVFVFSFGITVFASTGENQERNEITPYALVLARSELTKAIKSGSTISATAYTEGRSNATSSYVRIDLYRKAVGVSPTHFIKVELQKITLPVDWLIPVNLGQYQRDTPTRCKAPTPPMPAVPKKQSIILGFFNYTFA